MMFHNAPNPTQVQVHVPESGRMSPIPLLLFHDGGGNTVGYFMLGDLHRDVWAIHNTFELKDARDNNNIHEMAIYYLNLIHAAGINGVVYLGGMFANFK